MQAATSIPARSGGAVRFQQLGPPHFAAPSRVPTFVAASLQTDYGTKDACARDSVRYIEQRGCRDSGKTMGIFETALLPLRQAGFSLSRHKLRSILTIVCISWGVASKKSCGNGCFVRGLEPEKDRVPSQLSIPAISWLLEAGFWQIF